MTTVGVDCYRLRQGPYWTSYISSSTASVDLRTHFMYSQQKEKQEKQQQQQQSKTISTVNELVLRIT